MKTIEINVQMGLVGCVRKGTFEVEDETTEDEIDEIAQEQMFELITWGWRELDASEKKTRRR